MADLSRHFASRGQFAGTLAEFTEYWVNVHTPLLAAMPENAQYTRKYVQLHGTGATVKGLAAAPFDGVAEVWVDDLAAAEALFANEYFTTTIADDEANFMDRSKTVILFSTEDVVFGG